MTGLVCFDSTILILVAIITVVVAVYIFFYYQQNVDSLKNKLDICLRARAPAEKFSEPQQPAATKDPVKNYDLNNLNDPLVYPTTRTASYLFKPLMDNPLFFYPTRGYPDSPNYIANLVETNPSEDNSYNPQLPSVLQLMGYQKYPASSKFNYYVLLPSSGNSTPIKYVIETNRNEELYDGDTVKVLNKTYTVKKNKSPFEYFDA
jgi:hypothetical protein